MSKIGLIVEGGGMKCAYSAGVLDGFHDEGITFDYGIGVSAGSANLASFVAGQRGRNARFYMEHAKDPRYVGPYSLLTTGNMFGVKYIYGTLSNSDGADPIDYEAMQKNPMEMYVVATDALTAKAVYFSKRDMPKDDYRIVMASSAIPGASNPIEIGGRYYYDGSVSDSLPVERALADGCDKIVVLSSKTRDYIKQPEKNRLLYAFSCRRYPKIIEAMDHRHEMYRAQQKRMFELEREGKVYIFFPDGHLKLSTFCRDTEQNRRVYWSGLQDFQEQKEKFLKFLEEK